MSHHVKPGEFCWNELSTPDVKKAKEFYSKMFDWKFDDIQTEHMTYTLIKSHDKEFAGMWQIPTDQQKQIPPHWLAYIAVEDVAATLKKAQQNGAHVIMDVTEISGKGSFAIITDPTGAHIAFWEQAS